MRPRLLGHPQACTVAGAAISPGPGRLTRAGEEGPGQVLWVVESGEHARGGGLFPAIPLPNMNLSGTSPSPTSSSDLLGFQESLGRGWHAGTCFSSCLVEKAST